MIKAVIFDLDGVIVNSEPLHEETEAFVFSKYGIELAKEDWAMSKGRAFRDIVKTLAEKYGKDIDVEEAVVAKYERLIQNIAELKLFPGFIGLLKRLPDFKFAVTTSSLRPFAEGVLNRFSIKDAFSAIVTASDFEKSKPDPEPYLATIGKLEVKPEECVVIEDAVNGIKSAKSAGAYTIGVATTFGKKELEAADAVVGSLDEIDAAMIKDLGESYE